MDYKTALDCAILSQEVYRDFSNIKFSGWHNIQPAPMEDKRTGTQLAILENPSTKLAVIVFRGSDDEKDWFTNFKLDQEKKELIYPDIYAQASSPVRMHSGFIEAYLSVRDQIHKYIRNSSATQYRMTGHSLGGALAKLCAIDLQYNFGSTITVEAYTFGAPKVGNKAFVESYNRRVPNSWRVVNGWDVVSGLPRRWQGYRHVDEAFKIARKFTWRIITGSFEDHRIDNYIKVLKKKVG
ncbi:MAG: lipase family protein [Cyanobacteria bacterium J06635_1]